MLHQKLEDGRNIRQSMGVLESLPDRPLRRSEIDALENGNKIQGIFPVYGERVRDTAFALVLVVSGKAYALALSVDEDGWQKVDEAEVSDTPMEGVRFDEMETIQELQDVAAEQVSADEI